MNGNSHGIDIQRRSRGTNWPKIWRVRLIYNKNERADLRVTAYGNTMLEALDAAYAARDEASSRQTTPLEHTSK